MDGDRQGETAARLAAFCILCAVNLIHELIQTVVSGVDDVDQQVLAEETLSMVSAVTAMAARHALASSTDLRDSVAGATAELPHLYRDALFGIAIITSGDRSDFVEEAEAATLRLRRKQEFYAVHLPQDGFPSERLLNNKLGLWMGRISPPGLPTTPDARLNELEIVPRVLVHTRVVMAYLKKAASAA